MPNDSKTADLSLSPVAPRQIAILLGCVPERTHGVLLGQLANDERRRVQEELGVLDDVDTMERYRVLKLMYEQLQAETQSVEKVESEIQDEIQIGRARVAKKRSAAIYRQTEPASSTSLDDPLSGSSDRPERATAAVDPDHTTSGAAAASRGGFSADGKTLRNHDSETLRAQYQQTQAAGVLPPTSDSGPDSPRLKPTTRSERIDVDYRSETVRLQRANQDSVEHDLRLQPAFASDADELAERVDRYLNELSPQQLCQALGKATTKQAFLVLCGLPNETAEKVLGMLPRRQSRKVRQDMRRMGRLQLCEIDEAKQAVAELSLRLASPQEAIAA